MTFTPWTLIVDAGIISCLLLIGKLLRAKIKFIQKLFIPPSLLAGFFALIFGPEVLGWLPLSDNCGAYSAVLIAIVFGCIPLTSKDQSKKHTDGVGRMWAYSNAGLLLQWAFGGALGLWFFAKIWNLPPAFGLTMPVGFCGGHGTAAAIGEAFKDENIMSIAMTCATVGIIAAVVFGLAMIKWGSNHGMTCFIKKYSDLPEELRTGILPKDKRDAMGENRFSAISLDSLTFNLASITIIVAGGYGISHLIESLNPALTFPTFICAFLIALPLKKIFEKTGVSDYISKRMVSHISGTATDYLVAFGVASIKLHIVMKLIVPIIILLALGLLFTYLYVIIAGKRIAGKYGFEKAVFTWGWFTGTMSMSIALLRIVDPDMKTGILDDYAHAYIYVAPVEIALITLAPLSFLNGYGLHYVLICLVLGIATLIAARLKHWTGPEK